LIIQEKKLSFFKKLSFLSKNSGFIITQTAPYAPAGLTNPAGVEDLSIFHRAGEVIL